MTRRDLQLVARDKGRPWDLGKDVEQSSVASEIVPMPGQVIESGAIALAVNGETRQQSDVDKLIWNIREIIADLDRKSTRLNSSHLVISYAVFCLKKKKIQTSR